MLSGLADTPRRHLTSTHQDFIGYPNQGNKQGQRPADYKKNAVQKESDHVSFFRRKPSNGKWGSLAFLGAG